MIDKKIINEEINEPGYDNILFVYNYATIMN